MDFIGIDSIFQDTDLLMHRMEAEDGFHDDYSSELQLSRLQSHNSSQVNLPFKLHNSKTTSDQDIKSLFSMNTQTCDSFDLECEARSRSTVEDLAEFKNPEEDLVNKAIAMVETGRLESDSQTSFSHLQKLYLASIVHIRTGLTVNTDSSSNTFDECLSSQSSDLKFVQEINNNLSQAKEKRNDDRLRFIYKRTIKQMLMDCSKYIANKLHRMNDFEGDFQKLYFPHSEYAAREALDTSYASKKKLIKLFKESEAFKKDFLQYTLERVGQDYERSSRESYSSMLNYLKETLAKSATSDSTTLKKNFKRLPWRQHDVQSTIQQIVNLG